MDLYVDNFDRVNNIPNEKIKLIFRYPRGHWFCKQRKNLSGSVERFVTRIGNKIPIFVIYNIPNRDLGNFSSGGAKDEVEYLDFISSFCNGLKDKSAIIIFEPDAIPHAVSIQNEKLLHDRISLINRGLSIFKQYCLNAKIYVDIGHPRWLDTETVSTIMKMIYNYHGISINVSNFVPLGECEAYGNSIGIPYVIDTSRNGNQEFDIISDGWCNPAGRKVGKFPQLISEGLCEGYLWVKVPGESDGKENGGPKAGVFWPSYAKELLHDKKTRD